MSGLIIIALLAIIIGYSICEWAKSGDTHKRDMEICKWLNEADKYFVNKSRDKMLPTYKPEYVTKQYKDHLIDSAYNILSHIPEEFTKEEFKEKKHLFTEWMEGK